MATAERIVIDTVQFLAFAAAAQGQTDQALGNASQQDLAWQQQNIGNYMNALNVGVNQDNMENQFMANKFQVDQGRKDALMSASRQTSSNAFSNLGGLAFGAADLATKGGFGNSSFLTGSKSGGLNIGGIAGMIAGSGLSSMMGKK